MKIIDLIDFEKVDNILEGFNKSTGFVTAILDLEGNVLSKSGWRQICTQFHRVNPETSKNCTISDTVLAGEMGQGEKYHFYKCLNGMVDVAVPIIIKGEHIANLFSGQFFFEEPDRLFFQKQADKYGFNENTYLKALSKVPVVSRQKVLDAMDFLLKMTEMIAEMTMHRLQEQQLNEALKEKQRQLELQNQALKQAKEQVEKNERILRLFVEHSPASIAMFDNQMRYIAVSRRFIQDYNLVDGEIIGRSHYEIFPEISETWKTIHRRGLSGETIRESRDPFPRVDGTTDYVRWEIRPWHEADDQIGGIILFSEVITQQVEAEIEIRESENYNRMLFEQSAIGLALTSFDGRLVDINSTFARIIGCSVEEAKALTYWDLTPEKYKEQEQQQLELLARTGRYGPYEKEYIHKDGHLVPVRLQGLVIERNNEKFIWSSVEDITQRMVAQEALDKTNKLLMDMMNNSSSLIYMLDTESRFIAINRQFGKVFGRTVSEVIGRTRTDFMDREIAENHQSNDREIMKQRAPVSFEEENREEDGLHYYLTTKFPLIDNRNNLYGISGISTDITQRKRAEEKIREASSLIRIAAEKARLGGWNVNLEENKAYWSDEVAAIHEMPPGYSPQVEEGINFYAPEWRERIMKVFTDCAQKGVPYDEEMQILTATGKRVWIRTIGEAVRDENGRIFKVEGAFQDISEIKLAEEKTREKDLQFRKLSANVPDLIFQFTRKPDGSYCVPVASEGIRNIFGCSPEEVLDDFSPIGRVIYPEDAARVMADIEYSAHHMTHFTCEFRVQIPGKPIQWILSRSTPEKLPDGSITWYGFNADITQRKEFEDALRESEGKFRKIYEEGPFGMALVNSEFKFTMANRTFCQIMGYSESEMCHLTFRDITYEQDKDTGIESIRKLIKGDIPVFKMEKRYVRKDGQFIWGAITVAANFDKNGNFLYNLAIVEDITARKQADQELKILNSRLEILLHAVQELSTAQTLDQLQQIVPVSARRLIGSDGATIIFKEKEHCFYANEDAISPLWKGKRFELKNCISGWVMQNNSHVLVPDIYADERIPVDAYRTTFVKSLAMVPIHTKEPVGAIGIYWKEIHSPSEMEVSLLKTLADSAARSIENIQLYEELEERVQKRTLQLEAVNKELETFTYSVSHDLKAPLRGIDGYSKLLYDLYNNELNEEAKHFITTIRKSTQLMSQLIDDLLQYSRLERSQLRQEPVVIKSIVQTILKINEDEILSARFSVTLDLPDTPVIADSNGLQMALRNLVGNAIKFTKTVEKPCIEIKQQENERFWIISVKDNGIGFDMKFSQRIFEIFQRLHRVEDYPGTGIGLAMVAKAMQRMNGKVYAESEPGQGATFYLEIPKQS